MIAALMLVGGYLLGSIPSGLIVSRVYRGVDVRDQGSGKTGFTNTLRSLGLGAAVIVLVADVVKGAIPVLIARAVFDDPWAATLTGVAAVIGHTFPVFANFRGGRGVATAFGALLAIALWPSLWLALAVLVAGGAALAITRYVSVMSMTAAAVAFVLIVISVAVGWLAPHYLLFGGAATLAIELNHLPNMRRLLRGVEPKLGQGGASSAGS
ncbi:MAG: glycerol-3-phosphate 1-O-acyltransferase PlsY [Chloroflexi bacterium]|nr:glycerol-3-phosphate 1-O-acyltransferase PlsY [Chloroflexota bacterium]MYE32217.1 glycerol-3-phosphate 1-O-acyltransferase PlsY [Chloroflexota bacterium]